MPLNERNTRHPMRGLYAGQVERVRMLVRNDHMDANIVREVLLFNCWWSRITKQGQQLDGDVTTEMRKTLHIPASELKRVGVLHVNALARFIDKRGRFWMPESGDVIDVSLWENQITVNCQRTDPIPTVGV